MNSETLSKLLPELPPYILRKDVGKLTYGLVSPRTLANHDWKGTGPRDRNVHNGKVTYPRDAFVEWLLTRLKPRKDKKPSRFDALLIDSAVRKKGGSCA